MPHGMLDVYVEGAVGIKDTALLGKGNPYCTLTMGVQVFSSAPVPEGGSHPYFNTSFQFNVDSSSQELMVAVYRKSSLTDDDLLGYCTIFFKDAFYHSHEVPVTPYALTRPSGRPGGHIRLSLSFRSQPRPPAPAPGGYAPPHPRPVQTYRQPRPPGPHPPPPPRGGPPQAGPYRQPRPPYAGPAYPHQGPQRPQYAEPRRMGEKSESSSDSDAVSSNSDDGPPGPYQKYARGRGRGGSVGPPRGGGRSRPQQPGGSNVMGAALLGMGGMFMGAMLGSENGDGSEDWGGSGGGESFEDEYAEAVPESNEEDNAGGYQPVQFAPPPGRGRGRGGAPRGRGRAGGINGMDAVLQGVGGMVLGAMLGSDDGGSEEWGGGGGGDDGSFEDGGFYEEEYAEAVMVEPFDQSNEGGYGYESQSGMEDNAGGAPGGAPGGFLPMQFAPPPGRGRARGGAHRGRAGPPPGRGRAPMRGGRGPIARGRGPPPMRGRGPPPPGPY